MSNGGCGVPDCNNKAQHEVKISERYSVYYCDLHVEEGRELFFGPKIKLI